jgi:2-alkyl-3-oxoalkanoate reductase
VTRRTVLVTGASGRLGAFLVPGLQQAGWQVRALVHRRPIPAADETVRGDLLDPGTLAAATDGVDAVVHAAAVTHARRAHRYGDVNVRGTEAVLAAAAKAGVERVVHLSTRALGAGGGAYSDSKRAAEDLVREAGVPFTILRLPEVYGAGGEGIDRIIAAARAGRWIPIVGRGDDEVRPVHVSEAVAAVVHALETREALGKTYTLAGPALTLREAAEVCRAAYRSDSRIVSIPEKVVWLAGQLSRVLPLPLYPDQLDRLRAPRPAPSPEAAQDLSFRPAPLRLPE